MSALKALTTAQAKAVYRDKQVLFWSLAFPLMFLILFGFLNGDSSDSPKADIVQVGEVQLIDNLPDEAKQGFDQQFEVTESDDLEAALDELRAGDIDAVIQQSGNTIELRYSAADQVKSAQIRGIMGAFVDGTNVAMSGQPPTFTLDASSVEDDTLKAIQYLTPGLLGFAIAMGGTFGAAMPLVGWRKTRLLRRLRMSPVSTSSLVLSRVAVSMVIAIVQFTVFVLVAKVLFGLQLTGSWYLALPLVLCGTLAFMSIGMIAGSISKTEEAAAGLANVIVLPMSFLGGAFIPIDQAPGWLRTVANLLPMGHLVEGMTDVMVRGEGLSALWLPFGVLLAFTVVLATIAAKVFRWDD